MAGFKLSQKCKEANRYLPAIMACYTIGASSFNPCAIRAGAGRAVRSCPPGQRGATTGMPNEPVHYLNGQRRPA